MYEFVQQYQTLIVGGLGFFGVITTLIVNDWLARRQLTRQVQHDRAVVRIALRAELDEIAGAYREVIKTLEQPGDYEGIAVPLETMTDVYKSVIARIGLLSEAEVPVVLRAYLLAQELPYRVKMLPAAKHVGPGSIWVAAESFGALKQMHQNFLGDIEKASAALASSQAAADDP